MKNNLNYGVIIRELRKRQKMTNSEFAKEIGRSRGWLSDIERCNGKCQVSDSEFERILECFKAQNLRPMFRMWAANASKFDLIDRRMEGAVLKYVRIKKELKLKDVAKLVGCSSGYLSKVENGRFPPTVELRKRVLVACGYSPASFKNLYADPERSKVVPFRYKLDILMKRLSEKQVEQLFEYVQQVLDRCEK